MRALQRAFRKEDAVIGDDADRIAPDPGEPAHQGLPVELLELVEFAAVDDAGNDLAHLIPRAFVLFPCLRCLQQCGLQRLHHAA